MTDFDIQMRIVKHLDANADPAMGEGFAFVDLTPVRMLCGLDENEFRSKHVQLLEIKGIIEVNPSAPRQARLTDLGSELLYDGELEPHLGEHMEVPAKHGTMSTASTQDENSKALGVFIALSSNDDELSRQLENHLSLLRREGKILPWNFRRISGGREWQGQIDEHIDSAQIVLLLISADFIASDYCWDVEMNRALERHKKGEARVIPIILRHCDWHSAPFGKLQALPKDGRPVTGAGWSTRDEAFDDIAKGIRKVVNELAGV